MDTSAALCLIGGGLAFLGGLSYLVYFLRRFIKDPLSDSLTKKELIAFYLAVGVLSLGFALLVLSLFFAHPEWQNETSFTVGVFAGQAINWSMNLEFSLAGAFFFAASGAFLWSGFAIHYWKKKLIPEQKRLFTYFLFAAIPFFVLFFLMLTEGIAPYASYPLLNGFEFTVSGLKFTTAFDMGNYEGLHIAFYGIIMLFGVCVSYWVCDHKFYQEFHKHGILDNVVLVAFPAGVVGARIWYVVGNYSREFANQDFWQMFRIWDGGLTILGGAAAGILAGYLFLKFRRKYVDIRWALDVCVPSILLAQGIGRWGNFFNCEVYGKVTTLSEGWQWLPNWLSLQMSCNSGGGYLPAGSINTPLFLVEGLLSFAGYFLIVYGLGKGVNSLWAKRFKKPLLVKGDLAGAYFLWYGLVRVIMEPMRNAKFNMGTDNAWSICNSIVYIVIGLAIILALHLHDAYLKKRQAIPFVAIAAVLSALALVSPSLSSLTAATGDPSSSSYAAEAFVGFDLLFGGKAPALLVAYVFIGIAFLLFAVAAVLLGLHKEKTALYLVYGGIGLSVLGGAMFLLGKDWTTLGSVLTIGNVTYSLSYGFVLAGVAALWAALLGIVLLLSRLDAAKADKLAVRNAV